MAGDIRESSLTAEPRPELFFPFSQSGGSLSNVSLVIQTAGNPTLVTNSVVSAIRALYAAQPVYNIKTMAEVIQGSIADRKLYLGLLGTFAAVALALALRALGIGPGMSVVTVSHTAVATVAAIEMVGATPLLIDIEPDCYTMDPAELETVLKSHRLVTLTGVGGVGKTRLALEVASRVAGAFTDGVWVVELAPVTDPAAVPEAVAAVLGITQQPGMTVADSIAAASEGRERLLVFDNCEHILDAAAELIEAILGHSDTVRILATSREGLRLVDEQLWPVPSLDIGSSAAALFTERAQAVVPGISLTEDNDAVVEICRRLGERNRCRWVSGRTQSCSRRPSWRLW